MSWMSKRGFALMQADVDSSADIQTAALVELTGTLFIY